MAEQQFDAVVVGAGIIGEFFLPTNALFGNKTEIVGSSTAYHLQKAGRKTLLIEQVLLMKIERFIITFPVHTRPH